MSGATRPLELVNALAHLAYRAGILRTRRADAPVISVGNIALGGSGKTPLVAALARALLASGAHPAVLTRGYRRQAREPVFVHRQPDVSWERVGDEPALLARALPELIIVVDADRVRGARAAIERGGATHLILDDGFQHWRLERDLDLVVVDADDPLATRSPRRESPAALGRAGVIVVVGPDSSARAAAREEVRRRAPAAAVLGAEVRPVAVHRGERRSPAESLAATRVVAAAGIAAPHRFAATLRTLGADLVGERWYPDHHAWERHEIERLIAECARLAALPVATAKDAVKFPPDLLPRVAWLEIETVVVDGDLQSLVEAAVTRHRPVE